MGLQLLIRLFVPTQGKYIYIFFFNNKIIVFEINIKEKTFFFIRYFVGTHESTFTFRIQEDREILGFPMKTTFNRLCGDKSNKKNCKPESQWEIRW